MALKGNLRDFTITQLLNLINLARKTGVLIVEGPSETLYFFFRDGKLACAQSSQEDNCLATVLHQANRLTAAQHRAIKERAVKMSDKELGLLLINANTISQQDILACIQNHYSALLNRLFTWPDGLFRFENDLPPPGDKIPARISLENIIIEGARRLQEREQLQDEIPSLDMAVKFVDRPGTNLRSIHLSVEEWRVVHYINPKNSLRQIGRATQLNDLQIRRIIYGLLQAGLIEIVRPQGAPPPPPVQAQLPVQKANKEEQKSLITRLIDRIRSL